MLHCFFVQARRLFFLSYMISVPNTKRLDEKNFHLIINIQINNVLMSIEQDQEGFQHYDARKLFHIDLQSNDAVNLTSYGQFQFLKSYQCTIIFRFRGVFKPAFRSIDRIYLPSYHFEPKSPYSSFVWRWRPF